MNLNLTSDYENKFLTEYTLYGVFFNNFLNFHIRTM